MKILFVDNFRGFSNTFIPIYDVNFLVGENSTGKTSILSLLKLISSPEFWFGEIDFNRGDINFGHFNDIVSINAANRNYFSIGIIEMLEDKLSKENQINGFLITFGIREGMPRPILYAYSFDDNEFKIRLSPKPVRFKHRSIRNYHDIEEFTKEIFCEWILAYKKDTKGYRKLPREIGNLSNAPLSLLSLSIERVLQKKPDQFKFPNLRIPFLKEEFTWIAPIRTKPRRTYDDYKLEFSSEGSHTPYLIKKTLQRKTIGSELKNFLSRVGRDSGLFDSILTKAYGRGAIAPFELDVIIKGKQLSISNVGYGVSQALPVIVEVFMRPDDSWVAIQQPEVHLHPKAQAALGDMFFEISSLERKKFIVETHSDYTIDRFRLNYRRTDIDTRPRSQILYFERTIDGNKVYQIEIQDNGELASDQPKGYRDFFIKEEIEMLGI